MAAHLNNPITITLVKNLQAPFLCNPLQVGSGGAGTPPTVDVVSPAAGQALDRLGAVTFDVTDPEGLRDVVVWTEVAGAWEVVFGGQATGFSPAYSTSTAAAITNGWRFTVRRAGGWSASPTFHALAFDTEGNQT
jgi:hypothetical protein